MKLYGGIFRTCAQKKDCCPQVAMEASYGMDAGKHYEPFRLVNVWKRVRVEEKIPPNRFCGERTTVRRAVRVQVKVISKSGYSRMSYQAKEWMDQFEHWRRRA